MHWRLGTIGFSYTDWAGAFYPRSLDASRRLSHYAQHFDAVELDTTFHAMPSPDLVDRWRDAVPERFRFCLKTPRLITHDQPLTAASTLDHMRQFLRTAQRLGERLGVVLIQFPPFFGSEHRDALRYFLHQLPRDVRFAVEFRHGSWWREPAAAEMLSRYGIAWVAADEPSRDLAATSPDDPTLPYRPWPRMVTADWLYFRWIGGHDEFDWLGEEQLDPTPRLSWWIRQLQQMLQSHPEVGTIYGFFGNGYAGHAPATARRFQHLVGLPVVEPVTADTRQGSLF